MANQKAQQISIPFEAPLNMNKNVTDVKSFIGFNERNSPIFGGCLSPLFFKTEANTSNAVYDQAGNKYTLDNGVLSKNGTQLMTVNNVGYSREAVTNISTISNITVNPMSVNTFKYNTDGSLAYITVNGSEIICHYQYNGVEYTDTITAATSTVIKTDIHFDGSHALFISVAYVNSTTLSIASVDYNFSTNVWTNIGKNNSTIPFIAASGENVSNTFTYSNNSASFDCYSNMAITSGMNIKINYGLNHNGLILVSLLLFIEDSLFSKVNSQFSTINYCLDYNNMYFRGAYYKEELSPSKAISTAVRYPNTVIDGTDTAIYIGPTTGAVSGTTIKIYPFATINDISVMTSTISSYFTNDTFNANNATTNLPYYSVMGGHIRCAFVKNSSYGLIYDTNVGLLENTGVTIISENNAVSYNGACYNIGRWNLLYNLNTIFGISSTSNILLTEWTSVSDSYVITTDPDGYLLYSDANTNSYYRLKDNASNSLEIIKNRYIVINTTSTINCWWSYSINIP